MGATRALAPDDVVEGEEFDVVIDAAGGQSAIDLAYRLIRKFGIVLQFGLPHGAQTFDHEIAFRKQVSTHRSVYAQHEEHLACFSLALELLRRGTVKTDLLITETFPLPRLPEALKMATDPASGVAKLLIEVSAAAQS